MTEKELEKLVDAFEEELTNKIREIIREEIEEYFERKVPDFE
jgi:hypothetical protein